MPNRVRGADRLAATLGTAASDLRDLDASAAIVANGIRTDAARRAPRRTGRLAASGTVTKTPGKGAAVTFGNGSVRYAGPINYGVGPRTGLRGPHNIRATKFFSGAIAAAVPDAADNYIPEINQALDKVKGA